MPTSNRFSKYRQVSQNNRFSRYLTDEEPQDDKPFGERFGERLNARGQQKIGGVIQAAGESELRRKERIASVEGAYDKGGLLGGVAQSAQTYKTAQPIGGAIKYGVDKAVQAFDDVFSENDPLGDTLSEVGQGIAETGQINLKEAGEYGIRRPDSIIDEPGQAAKYYGAHLAESLIADMGPSIGIGMVAGPAAGLSTLGASVFGEEYARLRAEGKSGTEALEEAAYRTTAEVLPEVIPFGMALKPLGKAFKKTGNPVVDGMNRAMQSPVGSLAAVGATEAASEMVTETANVLYDKYALEEHVSFDDFLAQLKDAAVMGFGLGTGMRGASMGLQQADKWVKKRYENQIKEANRRSDDQLNLMTPEDLSNQFGAGLSSMGQNAPEEGTTVPDLGTQLDQNPASGGFDLNTGAQVQPLMETQVGVGPQQQDYTVELDDGTTMSPQDASLQTDFGNRFEQYRQQEPVVEPQGVEPQGVEPQGVEPQGVEPEGPISDADLEALFDEVAAEVEADNAAEAAAQPAEAQAEPEGDRFNSMGVRIADSKHVAGVDAGIADVLTQVNEAGFKTAQSASGLDIDYPTPETRSNKGGYVAFFKEDLNEEQQQAVIAAADKAGLYIDPNSDIFMSPAITVRALPAAAGQTEQDGREAAGKQAAEELGLPYSKRPSIAFPSKQTVDTSQWPKGAFDKWLDRRDEIVNEAGTNGVKPADAQVNRMWDDFSEALTGQPLKRTVNVGEIAPKAAAEASAVAAEPVSGDSSVTPEAAEDKGQEEAQEAGETVESLLTRFKKFDVKQPRDAVLINTRGEAGVKMAEEALRQEGYVEIPFGKSTLWVHQWKKTAAFARSQGDGAGVIVQFRKAIEKEVREARKVIDAKKIKDAEKSQAEKEQGAPNKGYIVPGVMTFRSGSSRISDLRGYQKAGVPVGVVISELSTPARAVLIQMAKAGQRIFIDSGAFTLFRKGSEMTVAGFKEIFSQYGVILSALTPTLKGKNVWFVMPDVIGKYERTIELQKEFAKEIGRFAVDSNPIFPIQKSDTLSVAEIAVELSALYAKLTGGLPYTIGIPSNAAAFSLEDLQNLLSNWKGQRPAGIHFLGIAAQTDKLTLIRNMVQHYWPDVEISSDANRIRAQTDKIGKDAAEIRNTLADDMLGEGGEYDETDIWMYGGKDWSPKFVKLFAAIAKADPAELQEAINEDRLQEFLEQVSPYQESHLMWAYRSLHQSAQDTRKGDARAEAVAKTEEQQPDLVNPSEQETDNEDISREETDTGRERGQEGGQPETTAGEQPRTGSGSEAERGEQEEGLTDKGAGEETTPPSAPPKLVAGDEVPNIGSIEATFGDEYENLGIKMHKVSDFDADPKDLFYAANDRERVRKLAQEIKESGRIDPLIVVIGADGPYILEGGHRLGALFTLGVQEFPALTIRDTSESEAESTPEAEPETGRSTFQGVYYYKTRKEAQAVAAELGQPDELIKSYERGYAIQWYTSGPYYGPDNLVNPKAAEKPASKPAEKPKEKTGKLENTGVDLRRHWEQLAEDAKKGKASGEVTWKLLYGKTGRASIFSPTPDPDATPGVQAFYDRVRDTVHTFAEVAARVFDLQTNSRGYDSYGPIGEQAGKLFDRDEDAKKLAFDVAREYITFTQALAEHLSGAKTVEEASAKLAEWIITENVTGAWNLNYKPDAPVLTLATVRGNERFIYPINPDRKRVAMGLVHWIYTDPEKIANNERRRFPDPKKHTPGELQKLLNNENEEQVANTRAKPLTRTRIDKIEREGAEVRKGKVTPLQVKNEFGFADVGFGSWVAKGRDQTHLNAAWDAFADLADRLGIPHKAIGFGGKMHFTIGALGHGKYAAHFSPNQPHPKGGSVPVINLTNTRGDGAVAHEWGHALDYLAMRGDYGADGRKVMEVILRELKAIRSIERVRERVIKAIRGEYSFGGRYSAQENAKKFVRYYGLRAADQTLYVSQAAKLGAYWVKDEELFARAWEQFIFETMGGSNNYLVNSWVVPDLIGPPAFRAAPYPNKIEASKFQPIFEALLKSFKTTEKGELSVDYEAFDKNLPKEIRNFESELDALEEEVPSILAEIEAERAAERERIRKEKEQENADKWAKAAEEAAAAARIADEARKAEEAAKAAEGETPESGPLTDEEYETIFNDALNLVQEETQEQPDVPQIRTLENRNETPEPGTPAPAGPKGGEVRIKAALKEAADLGVEGMEDVLKGLSKLFPPNKLHSFPPGIDKETYEAAKPYFDDGLIKFRAAGQTLRELFYYLIKHYGAAMKPYLLHWAKTERIDNSLKQTPVAQDTYPERGTLSAFMLGKVYEIHDNNDLKKALEEYHGHAPTETEIKAGQEALELALVRTAQNIVKTGGNRNAVFSQLLELYEGQPALNSRSATSMENQAYSTPLPLAFLASELSGITQGTTVYEPTAGNGALLIGANPVYTTANELNTARAQQLRTLGFDVVENDAVQWNPGKPVDAVIANPPFGALGYETRVDGYKITKIDHLIAANALDTALKDNGRSTLIIGANKEAGTTDAATKIFLNWLYSRYNVVDHFEVDGGLYRKQGASWPVAVITINGRQRSEQIFDRDVTRFKNWQEIKEHVERVLGSEEFTGKPASSTVNTGQPAGDDTRTSQPAGGASGKTGARSGRGGRTGGGGTSGVSGDAGSDVSDGAKGGASDSGVNADGNRRPGIDATRPGEPGAGGAAANDRGKMQDGNSGRPADKPQSLIPSGSDYQVPYQPASQGANEAVLIPVNMQTALDQSMRNLEAAVGNIDDYVIEKLGFKNKAQLYDSYMALQVDAVAAMVYNLEEFNSAVIIADQTGVGKGRQAAGMIRYALKEGMVPVFVTAQANLFTDMYDDMLDIHEAGGRPFIFNDEGGFIVDRNDGPNKFKGTSASRKAGFEALQKGKMPDGSNMLMLTYSQTNVSNRQRDALEAMIEAGMKPLFILDESHTVAGEREKYKKGEGKVKSRAGFWFELINEQAVVYLSATYAKRPDNMPIFYRTQLSDAVDDPDQLTQAIGAGGEALQTVVANMLAQAGQLWRRERSFAGISFVTETFGRDKDNNPIPEMQDQTEQHKAWSDAATSGLREIIGVDRQFEEAIDKNPEIRKHILTALEAEVGDSIVNASGKVEWRAQHSVFASIVHNFVSQLLLSMKADWIADQAIALHKAGKKPVIALNNTMGSFLDAEIARGNAEMGKEWNGDYRSILKAALANTRRVTMKNKKGDEVRIEVPLEALPEALLNEYKRVEAFIENLPLEDIVMFYIDYIRNRLEQAGITTNELTGRGLMMDYSKGGKPIVRKRKDASKKFRRKIVDDFNKGKIDALILNAAGSTGLSIHASEKFDDKRPRHMMVAQAIPDINILMQMLGRINRTGQVELPEFSMLGLDLPSERRPLAMTARKMRSLNANTSANTESETSLDVTAMLNKHGDQVVYELLLDEPSLQEMTGVKVDEKTVKEDLALRWTGKLALAPIEDQEMAWEQLTSRYKDHIDYLDATGQNDLRTDVLDLQAKIIESKVIYQGKAPGTIFGGDTTLHKVTINMQGRAPSAHEVLEAVSNRLGEQSPMEVAKELTDKITAANAPMIDDLQKQIDAMREEWRGKADTATEEQKEKANAEYTLLTAKMTDRKGRLERFQQQLARFQVRTAWKLDIGDDVYTGVVTDVIWSHKDGKGDPLSPSKLRVKFMINGPQRTVVVPMSKILGNSSPVVEPLNLRDPQQLINLFNSKHGPSARETRYIATGNLLGGYSALEPGGRVVIFTGANGKTYPGILMPRKFGKKGEYDDQDDKPQIVRDPADLVAYLKVAMKDYNLARFGAYNLPDQEVRIFSQQWGEFSISVPRKRTASGDKVKFDKPLAEAMGREFVGRTQTLTVSFDESRLPRVAARLVQLLPIYIPGSGVKTMQEVTGKARPAGVANFDGTTEADDSLLERFDSDGELFEDKPGDTAPKFSRSPKTLNYGRQSGRGGSLKGMVTFLSRQLEATLSRYTKVEIDEGTFVQVEAPKELKKTAETIRKVFGRRVVFFRQDKAFPFTFNGMVLPHDAKTLYVNIDAAYPFAGVIGHELLHTLRKTDPDLYNTIAELAKRRLKSGALEEFARRENKAISKNEGDRRLNEDKMFEEMVANLVGDALLDQAFLDELANTEPSMVKRLLNAVLKFLQSLRTDMQRKGLRSDQHFNDINALIAETQYLLKNYRKPGVVKVRQFVTADVAAFDESTDDDTPSFSRQQPDPFMQDPTRKNFLKRAGLGKDTRKLGDRVLDFMARIWMAAKYDLSDSIQLGMFDKFYGIKKAYRDVLDVNPDDAETGYVAARLSTGNASVMRALLLYGAPKYGDDVIERIPGSQGLLDVFAPIHEELDRFLGWMIARRADRLMAEGKENNFTRDEIDAALEMDQGDILINGRPESRADVYDRVAEDFATFKGSILDLAESAGLIDATTRPLWDKADWIPFYRLGMFEGRGGGLGAGKGLSHQRSGINKLRGGEEALDDPLGNIIMNFNHLIAASMRNHALLRTIDDLSETDLLKKTGWKMRKAAIPRAELERIMIEEGVDPDLIDALDNDTNGLLFEGMAQMWSLNEPTDPDIVRVMRDGRPEFYRVEDPMLLTSLANMNITPFQDPITKLGRGFKTLLTTMVTSEPTFMARNWIRDALHAYVINEDHFVPFLDSARGLNKSWQEKGGMLDMMFAGGSFQGGYINGTDPNHSRKSIRQALRAKGYSNTYINSHIDTIVDTTSGLWDRWRQVGDAFENANREAVYEAATKAGKTKAQAIFEAKDLMDFSMHGSWAAIRWFTEVVPFLNARLQGLYKLGRSGAVPLPGLIARKIAMKGVYIMIFSILLGMMNDDNEEYQALEDWDKDSYWHFFPGTPYHTRFPKPFEVGILYGTIPERAFRLMKGDDTWGKFWNRMGHAMWDTMAFNPMPQIFKPAMEVWANQSTFTGRPIENLGDERVAKRARYSGSTSDTMVAMGPLLEQLGLSPKQAEFLVRGYLGTLGNYALMASDVIVRDIIGRAPVPASNVRDLPVVGSFVRGEGPAWNTRYGTELYEMHKEVTELWGTVKAFQKRGEKEDAKEILADPEARKRLRTRKALAGWADNRANMRRMIEKVYQDEKMTPAQKREKIDQIIKRRNELDAKAYKYFSPMFDRK